MVVQIPEEGKILRDRIAQCLQGTSNTISSKITQAFLLKAVAPAMDMQTSLKPATQKHKLTGSLMPQRASTLYELTAERG